MNNSHSGYTPKAVSQTPHREFSYIGVQQEYLILALLLFLSTILMSVLSNYDFLLTLWLHEYRWKGFVRFMGQTIFEGDHPGGGDIGVLFCIVASVAYLLCWNATFSKRFSFLRTYSGFIVISYLTCGVIMVHGLKWLVARPRPSAVFDHGVLYSEWYEFGAYMLADGGYRGSMPSGHTCTIILLLTISYILTNPSHTFLTRCAGILWGLFTIVGAVLMGICRAMSFSHWVTDCLFSICAGWLIIHVLYYWIVKVPEQVAYLEQNGNHPPTLPLWELKFCGLLFLTSAGILSTVLGIRALMQTEASWPVLLAFPGLYCTTSFAMRLHKLLVRVTESYQSPQMKTDTPSIVEKNLRPTIIT